MNRSLSILRQQGKGMGSSMDEIALVVARGSPGSDMDWPCSVHAHTATRSQLNKSWPLQFLFVHHKSFKYENLPLGADFHVYIGFAAIDGLNYSKKKRLLPTEIKKN